MDNNEVLVFKPINGLICSLIVFLICVCVCVCNFFNTKYKYDQLNLEYKQLLNERSEWIRDYFDLRYEFDSYKEDNLNK